MAVNFILTCVIIKRIIVWCQIRVQLGDLTSTSTCLVWQIGPYIASWGHYQSNNGYVRIFIIYIIFMYFIHLLIKCKFYWLYLSPSSTIELDLKPHPNLGTMNVAPPEGEKTPLTRVTSDTGAPTQVWECHHPQTVAMMSMSPLTTTSSDVLHILTHWTGLSRTQNPFHPLKSSWCCC